MTVRTFERLGGSEPGTSPDEFRADVHDGDELMTSATSVEVARALALAEFERVVGAFVTFRAAGVEFLMRETAGETSPGAVFARAQKRADELLADNNRLVEEARAARREQRKAEITRDGLAEWVATIESLIGKLDPVTATESELRGIVGSCKLMIPQPQEGHT